ncbi:MAG: bifunctional 3,4-dihydroxy-2-butanone-4-phosphate synthase/GTP cyclohydrolase II [Deltaproteobacteria bacterium]|nr:bifunctional 3,4-dihydroxy-2-butanone-4-phosphate synthase/GTP cyclohydrolase II [Deltaproteobacteria bacterium]
MVISRIEQALRDIKAGKMLILVDDEDRENEGDLVIAAEKTTPEAINFMAKYGRGLICLTLTEERADFLNLPPMVPDNTSQYGTAFTVSIEARRGVSTGISAADRCHTILTAIDDHSGPHDLARPGHIFPLRARRGGVLVRTGQTEGSVDLARLAGLKPAGVICEIMNDDGTMARMPELREFAEKHNLSIISIADIIEYRMRKESLVQKAVRAHLPTRFGEFEIIVYENQIDNHEHLALIKGDLSGDEPVLVRVHSECFTGDTLGSLRCDCADQLHTAMERIEKEGRGAILYMRQEGRGIGLVNKLRAYCLQEHGRDTVEANEELGFKPDLRDYGVGAQILVDLGLKKIRLLTNNPTKIVGLQGYDIEIVERIPLECTPNETNICYLQTKREKMGHLLDQVPEHKEDLQLKTPGEKNGQNI